MFNASHLNFEKGEQMEKETKKTPEQKQRREFLEKFGKLAAVAPVGMFMLMGPGASKAQASNSKTSGHLYGFDNFASSAFFFLKNKLGTKDELLQAVVGNSDAQKVIYTIDNLLNGKEEAELKENSENDLDLKYPLSTLPKKYKNPFYYKLDTFVFVIDTQEQFIIEKILPALEHMQCKECEAEKVTLNIDIKEQNSRWSVSLNGKVIRDELEATQVLPRVQDYIRISYYRSTDYLISLHSGALYFNKIPLIMPASSGSGKSTLSTYLMHQKGFEFLTDEVVMIDKSSHIWPIPLAITIKEGSWSVLESYGISLKDLPVHKRFDGQSLHFLPPVNIATQSRSLKEGYLIFPKYSEGADTELKPLTTLEALNIITTSGYEVFDSYDEKTIELWVKTLENLHKYTITYSSLEDAKEHIERVMQS